MNFFDNIQDIFVSFLERLEFAWWIEIATEKPHCIYYFGPFICPHEAQEAQPGYIQDLEEEKAQGITLNIKQFQPKNLMICEDE
ncbi:MAG: DUF1816 domain-containing protein [Stigonema ocellatum SAG 48.90 = DSM 106950]|nr:DUF1816 domain-containing protein [Stigonema ocellatum SAG 48.90 = DSM 106950]